MEVVVFPHLSLTSCTIYTCIDLLRLGSSSFRLLWVLRGHLADDEEGDTEEGEPVFLQEGLLLDGRGGFPIWSSGVDRDWRGKVGSRSSAESNGPVRHYSNAKRTLPEDQMRGFDSHFTLQYRRDLPFICVSTRCWARAI
jgi:hypothetical protein